MKKTFNTRVLAEIAIFAAIGFALDMLQGGIFRGIFVNGGSIGLAMLPVLVIAYRRGLVPGLLCGLVLSVIQMLGGIYIINGQTHTGAMVFFAPFFQVLLDYVLGYTVVGFAGVFAKNYKNANTAGVKMGFIIAGAVLGGLLKYASHVISGGAFWLDPSITFLGVNGGSWWYSFFYNGLYCIPNTIICAVVMVLIAKFYPVFLNPEKEDEFEDELASAVLEAEKEAAKEEALEKAALNEELEKKALENADALVEEEANKNE